MRPPVHLTFEAIVALLGHTFERLPDARDPERLDYFAPITHTKAGSA